MERLEDNEHVNQIPATPSGSHPDGQHHRVERLRAVSSLRYREGWVCAIVRGSAPVPAGRDMADTRLVGEQHGIYG